MLWIKRFKKSINSGGSGFLKFCDIIDCSRIGVWELTIIDHPAGSYCQKHKTELEKAWIESQGTYFETSKNLTKNL